MSPYDRLRSFLKREYPEPFNELEVGTKVELGCGEFKSDPRSVGVDLLPYEGVEVVGEIPAVLSEFADGAVDAIYSHHFMEHAPDVTATMRECARILRPGGRFIAVGPHFSNPHYYSDPTHRNPLGLYTMSYFATDAVHRRQVPIYSVDESPAFTIDDVSLRFRSTPRQPISHVVCLLLEWGCARSTRFREMYERRLAWILPCREIRYELVRTGE